MAATSEQKDIEQAQYRRVASPWQAMAWAMKCRIRPTIWYHGTSKANALSIRRHGFHGLAAAQTKTDVGGNYFTWLPHYAQVWAGQNGVILVCQIMLRHPMPEERFHQLYHGDNLFSKLLTEVKKRGYDGSYLGDEAWVWDPQAVTVIGKMLPEK